MIRTPAAMAADTSARISASLASSARPAASHLVPAVDHMRSEPPHVAVVVDVHDLGEVIIGDHRIGQHDLAARGRAGIEQVMLRASRGAKRGDELLPDSIQRRIGDLRE